MLKSSNSARPSALNLSIMSPTPSFDRLRRYNVIAAALHAASAAVVLLLANNFALPVTADYNIDPGKKNGVAIRIALIRPQIGAISAEESANEVGTGKVRPAPNPGSQSTTAVSASGNKRKSRTGK